MEAAKLVDFLFQLCLIVTFCWPGNDRESRRCQCFTVWIAGVTQWRLSPRMFILCLSYISKWARQSYSEWLNQKSEMRVCLSVKKAKNFTPERCWLRISEIIEKVKPRNFTIIFSLWLPLFAGVMRRKKTEHKNLRTLPMLMLSAIRIKTEKDSCISCDFLRNKMSKMDFLKPHSCRQSKSRWNESHRSIFVLSNC